MYIQKLAENLIKKGVFVFEIFSFKADAYMCLQKMFCAVADLTNLL
jgi:hypothetical protein